MNGNRAYGIDISHHQKTYIPQAHHDFVIIKAVDGVTKNSKYDLFYDDCRNAGKIVGAYSYFRSGIGWSLQLNAFLEIAEGADFLAVDFEKFYNIPSYAFAENAYRMVKGCWECGYATLLYSNPAVIQEWMFQKGSYWVLKWPNLWIAQWPFYGWNAELLKVPYPEKGWQPRLPAGCNEWKFWQFSGDKNRRGRVEGVGSRDCDLDVFNGTAAELRAWCGIEDSEEYEKPSKCNCGEIVGKIKNVLEGWKPCV